MYNTMGILYYGIVLITLCFITPQLWALQRNYRAARATGLPIVVFPYDPDSVSGPFQHVPCIQNREEDTVKKYKKSSLTSLTKLLHIIFANPLRPVLHAILPTSLFDIFELTTFGWEFRDKAAIHERLGLNFIIVSPGVNRLICAEPAVGQTILARRKDFVHQDVSLQAMGFLGKNIITVCL